MSGDFFPGDSVDVRHQGRYGDSVYSLGSYSNTHHLYFALGAKMKVRTLFTLTGSPLRIAGLKTHLRAASTAALRSAKWPLMAVASTTRPASEMVISTSTGPVAFIFLAVGG